MYLGIEIGGTKLQIGLGAGDGVLTGLWRGTVDRKAGPEGIRRQLSAAVPGLLQRHGIESSQLRSVGVGFGGPVDDRTRTIIKSHQIDGWDNFPLADWIGEVVGLPAVLGNDADVAGLAEALHGAGQGLSPLFYITIGSGIGGGFILDGEIYRGVGLGAAEFGHMRCRAGDRTVILEEVASGWGMEAEAKAAGLEAQSVPEIIAAAEQRDSRAQAIFTQALDCLAEALTHVIALLCPRRIVIGGGVSLLGEQRLFQPLRERLAQRVFRPFAGLTDLVPASLGEEVVVHGALALAGRRLG